MVFLKVYQRVVIAFFVLIFLLASCTTEKGNQKRGEHLFHQAHLGKQRVVGCVACHSTAPGQVIIGPSLAGLSVRAAYLVPGQSAEDYIKDSIVNPDAYIVDGFMPAIMFSHYADELSQTEIDALVAYLLTL